METITLNNGVKIIYEYRRGDLTSFSIGLDAGALREEGYTKGCAHFVEHMVFKGTDILNEDEINNRLDKVFGFNNAMTNYPYVVYYGTCLSEDLNEAFSLYGSIVTKPSFKEEGFKEEKHIIIQEAMEWKEDLEQYIEDELLYNSFNKRRIKDIIIGREEELKNITLEEVKDFYNKHYIGENMVISFVTSKGIEEIKELVSRNFKDISVGKKLKALDFKENIKEGVYKKSIEGLKGSKILYGFDIGKLNEKEIEALYIFNMFFGEGVSSILFSNIRTKEGLAYEIKSNIKYEKGIRLFTIYGSSSKDKIDIMKDIIDNIILNIKDYITTIEDLEVYKKRLLMKFAVNEESSIRRALRLCTNDIMFNTDIHKKEIIKEVNEEFILEVVEKVFKKGALQIFK